MARHCAVTLVLALVLAGSLVDDADAQPASGGSVPPPLAGALRRGGKDFTKDLISTRNATIGGRAGVTPFIFDGKVAPKYRYVVGISYTSPRGEAVCTGTLMGKRL